MSSTCLGGLSGQRESRLPPQRLVIRRVPGLAQERRRIERTHVDAVAMPRVAVHRAHHHARALRSQALNGGVEQQLHGGGAVEGLEPPERAQRPAVLVEGRQPSRASRHDAGHRHARRAASCREPRAPARWTRGPGRSTRGPRRRSARQGRVVGGGTLGRSRSSISSISVPRCRSQGSAADRTLEA